MKRFWKTLNAAVSTHRFSAGQGCSRCFFKFPLNAGVTLLVKLAGTAALEFNNNFTAWMGRHIIDSSHF